MRKISEKELMRLLERAPRIGGGEPLQPRLVNPDHVRLPIPGHKYHDNLVVGGMRYTPTRGMVPKRHIRAMPEDYLEKVARVDDQIRALRAQRQLLLDEAWRRAKPVRIKKLRKAYA
jgi:hypothetical protein